MNHISTLLTDLLNTDDAVGAVMDRYLAPGYRQRTDGHWAGRAEVGDHFDHLRHLVGQAQVTVHEELLQGEVYAERHTVQLTKRDGGEVTQEVYVFGRVDADGRFTRVEEVTLLVAGDVADRGIGSAR